MRTVTTLPVTEKTVGPKYDATTKLGNWDDNRTTIDKIIIHTMVGYAEGADERFNDASSNVSANYGVRETGEIWHWVDEDKVAYHAGDYPTNQRSIGIEFEDNGQPNNPRPDSLYTSGAALIREIAQYYNIPIDREHIQKHLEVSDQPTSCPDALDINRLVSLANNPQSDPLTQCRNDRDLNWNCYVLLLQALDLTPDSNDKMAQAQIAVKMINDLKNKPQETNQIVQTASSTPSFSSEPKSNTTPVTLVVEQIVERLLNKIFP